jgi:hypothetical protein|tara:strand:- start:72 stop:719 length:648 start_codon:yes stop_codon:yes gene_type:complete
MNTTINFNDNSLDATELNNIIKKKININNVKLLENPIEINNNNLEFTLLKIICNKDIKVFLKNIESLFQNDNKDISIVFNYDSNKNIDYYELLLNKKIPQIIDNLDINKYYNIDISLVNNDIVLWKIHSIEISDNYQIKEVENDINLVENFEPDYQEIQNGFITEINELLKSRTNDLKKLEKEKSDLEEFLKEIKNKYNLREIENYRNKINSYID